MSSGRFFFCRYGRLLPEPTTGSTSCKCILLYCLPSSVVKLVKTSYVALGFRDNIQPLTYCLCINCYAFILSLLISPLQNGSTALHQVSFAGETEEVEKVLAKGVDINQQADVR